ncbi:MAG: glycerophosphodiester phosphodiesterase family protein [Opitutaceae bacterium]|nr:glycerophosphodiester phosphodiesterase family protein [Opitutaceae bacterium]
MKHTHMKHTHRPLLIIAFLLGAATTAFATTRADRLRAELLDPASPRVFVASHRGDWRNAPENSVDAIEKAIALGVDIVEIDLARTKDGELVLMHDRAVDRTTTGKGKVSALTLAEIKALRLRNGAGHATVHRVPTLREAMLAAKDRVLINLDKSYEYWAEALPILRETGTLHQIIIKGPVTAAKASHDIGPDINRAIFMPVVDFSKPGAAEMLDTYTDNTIAKAVELVFADDAHFTPVRVQKLRDARIRIWVNSLWPELCGGHDDDRSETDPAGAHDWLIARGATILQTDRPAPLLARLRAQNLHD